GVAMEALRRLREVAALLEDHGLVEDGGGIGRALLLGFLEETHGRVELALLIEEAAAREELPILFLDLALLLEFALKLELELELGDERLLRAVRIELVVAVDFGLGLGDAAGLGQGEGHVVEDAGDVGLELVGFRELSVRRGVVLHGEILLAEEDGF